MVSASHRWIDLINLNATGTLVKDAGKVSSKVIRQRCWQIGNECVD